MNKTQAGRLLTLATYLREEVKNRKFNMGTWGNVDIDGTIPITRCSLQKMEEKHPCKTSACALGYATNIWPHKFRLKFFSHGEGDVLVRANGEWSGNIYYTKEFFGIDDAEFDDLFLGPYMTPKQKAKDIEGLVAKHGWVYA